MIWRGKITSYRKLILKRFISMKLSSIVECNRLESTTMLLYSAHACNIHLVNRSCGNLLDDYKARFPLDESYDTMMAIPSNNGISFPMTDLETIVYSVRTIRNRPFTG
jgi:hypothetical protein